MRHYQDLEATEVFLFALSSTKSAGPPSDVTTDFAKLHSRELLLITFGPSVD
jgi:hypothetical protein